MAAILHTGLGVEPPFFLRQLRTAKAWGDAAAPTAQRIDDAIRAVFRVDEPAHSLFEIRSAEDLRRVVVALAQTGRSRPVASSSSLLYLVTS